MKRIEIASYETRLYDTSLERYYNEIKGYPRVTQAEERELLTRVNGGDQKALDRLVCFYLRFVFWTVRQYQNCKVPLPDLISEGNIGLISSIKRYRNLGPSLTTYVAFGIRQQIIRGIMWQSRTVWLPGHQQNLIQKIKKNLPRLERVLGREPSNLEIAEDIGVTEATVVEANECGKYEISFDKPLADESCLYNLVPDRGAPAPDEKVMGESLTVEIGRALKKLSEREAEILTMYFGLNGTPSYFPHDIAAKYNINEQMVSIYKRRALHKLKRILKESYVLLEYQ